MMHAANPEPSQDANATKVEATQVMPGPELLPQLAQMLDAKLSTPFGAYLDAAIELLFKRSQEGEDDALRDAYFQALTGLRNRREALQRGYLQGLKEELLAIQQRHTGGEISFANLSLVDDSLLEEDLAVDSIANRASERLNEELEAIAQVLGKLHHSGELDERHNPLSPRHFANRLGQVLDELRVERKVRLALYALFEKRVLDVIDPLFTEIDDYLIQRNLVSKQRTRIINKASEKAKEREKRAEKEGGEAPPPQGGGDGGEMLAAIHALAQLRAGGGGGGTGGAGGGGGGGGPVALPAQLATALSAIQPQVFSIPPGISPVEIGEKVKSQLGVVLQKVHGTDQPMEINTLDSTVIDVVSMVFEKVLDDDNLSANVKATLARLQIPLLKVAIMEKGLLEQETHPARQLVNHLAQLGLSVNEGDKAEESPLLRYIEKSVQRVVVEFKDDMAFFVKLNEQVLQFSSAYRAKEAEADARRERRLQRREQLQQARLRADALVDAQLAGAEPPELLQRLLDGPWRKALVHAYMNGGEGGELWQQRCACMRDLLWSVTPIEGLEPLKAFRAMIPEMMRTLRGGLAALDIEEARIERVVAQLEPLHRKNLERLKAAESRKPARTSSAAMSEEERVLLDNLTELDDMLASLDDVESLMHAPAELVAPPSELFNDQINDAFFKQFGEPPSDPRNARLDPAHEPHDDYLTQARTLEVGHWLHLLDGEGREVRAKLSWKSELLGEYTFVNWKFSVVAELSLYHLARELREGRARLIESAPILDRALRLVTNLLKRKVEEAPHPA